MDDVWHFTSHLPGWDGVVQVLERLGQLRHLGHLGQGFLAGLLELQQAVAHLGQLRHLGQGVLCSAGARLLGSQICVLDA